MQPLLTLGELIHDSLMFGLSYLFDLLFQLNQPFDDVSPTTNIFLHVEDLFSHVGVVRQDHGVYTPLKQHDDIIQRLEVLLLDLTSIHEDHIDTHIEWDDVGDLDVQLTVLIELQQVLSSCSTLTCPCHSLVNFLQQVCELFKDLEASLDVLKVLIKDSFNVLLHVDEVLVVGW